MLYQGYFANLKNYPENEMFIVVSRYYPRWLRKGLSFRPELAPSKELLNDYKQKNISWEEYEKRFSEEIANNPKAVETLSSLASASQYDDFRLLCYEKNPPCHRFLLINMVNLLKYEHRSSLSTPEGENNE